METQKERLFAFIKAIGFSVREFERTIGVSNGTVRHLSDTLSANIKDKISTNFLQLNINWLLTGNGEMLVVPTEGTPRDDRETTEQITKDQPRTNQGTTNEVVALLKKQIEQLEYIVELQKDRILQLEKECEDLKKANSTAATSRATTA